jgi:iron complex outermembrane receptor protein
MAVALRRQIKGTKMPTKFLKGALLASTVIAGSSLFAAPAFAQDNPPPSGTTPPAGSQSPPPGVQSQDSAGPAEQTSAGDIVVTGTLIKNPNLVASSPVAVVGQEEIQLRQTNVAEEILRDLPGAVPSIGSAVNNGNGGASYADLRGLGAFRNLVLLDGNRIVPATSIGRTDLNNIPLALVQRVDTLTGGAATTYGADAVSGVINFITRSDFAGMEFSGSEQITQKGDGAYGRFDLTVGANFDDGRGNAVISVGYQKADPVYQGARNFSINNYTSSSGAAGGSGTTVPSRFTLSGLAPAGDPARLSGNRQINPTTGATVTPVVPFNFNPYNIFQTPFKRYNIYGAGHYDLSDTVEVYTRGMFSKNTVNTIIAPSGIFGSVLAIPFSNPYLPAAARAQFCANNPTFNAAGVQVAQLTPAQCAAAAVATSKADPNFRYFTVATNRRTTEVGPRISEFVTTFFDYRAGVKLHLTDKLTLDVSGSYGESENRQTQQNYVLTSRARSAVFATNTTTCLGGAPGGADVAAGTGCVPLNIFGPAGSITANQIPYLTTGATTTNFVRLAQARALLSGDFGFSSPWAANPVGFAAGAEYRKYTAGQQSDTLSQTAGELGGAGGAAPVFTGTYQVREAYGEIIAPLISDRTLFQSLTLEGGIRYSHYEIGAPGSPSFNTTTYKAGGSWEPVNSIKFRGSYQRAVRAPNIAELFVPVTVGLTTLAFDACAGAAPVTNANLRAVCLAQGAPAASIGSIQTPTASQANQTSGGNINLRPEKADSYTVGVVLQPTFLHGLSITVDYYHIKINGAISQPTAADAYNLCFGNPAGAGITASSATNPNCTVIRRNPATGGLDGDPATTNGLFLAATNQGRVLTDGIDFGVNYRRNLGFAKLNLSFQGNWTHRAVFQATAVSAVRECVGLYGPDCGSPASAGPSGTPGSIQPKYSWNQRTTLTFGPVDVSLLWRYISAVNVEPGRAKTFNGTITTGALAGQSFNFGHISAYNYFDLSTRVGVSDNFDLTLTVTNLLDKKPPVVGSTIGTTAYNSGNTYPSTYDALGRRFAVGARLKF